MPPLNLTGFVLAGGRSTRMGRDKALLDWHGHSLLEHMVNLLRTVADEVRVSGRDELPDLVPGLGPLSGIAAGLEVSATEANLFVAVDLPFLTEDLLKYVRARLENSTGRGVAFQMQSSFPLCLGVSRSALPEIQKRLASRELSIRGFIEASNAALISESELHRLGFSSDIFRNLNTPEDYTECVRKPREAG